MCERRKSLKGTEENIKKEMENYNFQIIEKVVDIVVFHGRYRHKLNWEICAGDMKGVRFDGTCWTGEQHVWFTLGKCATNGSRRLQKQFTNNCVQNNVLRVWNERLNTPIS